MRAPSGSLAAVAVLAATARRERLRRVRRHGDGKKSAKLAVHKTVLWLRAMWHKQLPIEHWLLLKKSMLKLTA